MIFQQLFPLCSCTAADRTLQIMLIATTTVSVCVCVCSSPKGSSVQRCSETQQRVEGHPTSITIDIISTEETQVCCASYVRSMALAVFTWMQLYPHITRL